MKQKLIIAAFIGVVVYLSVAIFSGVDESVTVKELLDEVSSKPIPSEVAKFAFNNAVTDICEINGVDTANGFGTTEECLNNFKTLASVECISILNDFDNKVYDSKAPLESDFRDFFSCSIGKITL